LKKEIATYVSDAQILLNNSQYQQAIDAAKNILVRDVDNTAAKMILESSIIKLKEIAQNEINALTKQEPKKIIEDSDLVPSISGQ